MIICARDYKRSILGAIVLVDKEVVTLKLQELERYLDNLKKHQDITIDSLTSDLDQAWIVQHGLQLCIQLILDIGNHILAEEKVPVTDYAQIFHELSRLKIIPEDFAQKIKGMAGLRNILVHEYSDLNLDNIVDLLNNRLDDFTTFSEYVMDYLSDPKL